MALIRLIACDAHEVVLVNFNKETYKCIRCGIVGSFGTMFNGKVRCKIHYELPTSGWRGPVIAFESIRKDDYLTDNVIDLEQAKKLLLQTAGSEPPLGDNWLTSLPPGTIFLSRPKQKGGVKQMHCDQFCVVEHKEVTTNLLQKAPTGQQIDIWYPSLEFSRNNDYIETIAQVKFGYSEEQLKTDENLPEEEGVNNDGNNGDSGRSV